jgi:hypothetical protein
MFRSLNLPQFENVDSSFTWIEVPGVEKYPELGIARGKLKLSGYVVFSRYSIVISGLVLLRTTVAGFFERSLNKIKEGLEKAHRASGFRAKVS